MTSSRAPDPGTSLDELAETRRVPEPRVPEALERYDVGEQLGMGGMAVVYRLHDRLLGRDVALKQLQAALTTRPLEHRRFLDEARILAQLEHPNIVPLHDLALGETPQILMKLVGGRTLEHYMDHFPVPREPEVLDDLLQIFGKVCDAVAFAHSRGIVHRDLKPQNVMVDAYGQVYVMDWGLARVLDENGLTTGPDDGAGTLAYMAPEQAEPKLHPLGRHTDVFALGTILYEILTGRPPYLGEVPIAVRAQACLCEIERPEDVVPGGEIPAGLSRIVMKALSREPRDRHASVVELKQEIERFARGGGTVPVRTFAPGELVVREGDVGDEAYVITAGRCEAFKTVNGQRVPLREMGPGDVFGEMAILASRPRTASVEALEPLTVRVVARQSIAEGLGLNTWMGAFVRALAERFVEVDAKATQLEMLLARKRDR